jgi:hypothetical protein
MSIFSPNQHTSYSTLLDLCSWYSVRIQVCCCTLLFGCQVAAPNESSLWQEESVCESATGQKPIYMYLCIMWLFVPTIRYRLIARGHLKRNRDYSNKFIMDEFMVCFPLSIVLYCGLWQRGRLACIFIRCKFKFSHPPTITRTGTLTITVRVLSISIFWSHSCVCCVPNAFPFLVNSLRATRERERRKM